MFLELDWGFVAQRGVFAVGIVVGFDVGEDLHTGVGVVDEAAALEHFAFQGGGSSGRPGAPTLRGLPQRTAPPRVSAPGLPFSLRNLLQDRLVQE